MTKMNVNIKVIIEELHRAFKLFNKEFFENELPEPAILVQSRGNKKLTLGWCTVAKVWKNELTQEEKYEINLVAEALNRGVYPVMATLLHEMVHLHNLVNDIKDTSRGGTYHNMKFRQVAEEHGLIAEHEDRIGWSVTKLTGLTMDLLDSNGFSNEVFSFGRRDYEAEGVGKPRKKAKTSSRKYICPCCGTSIRASKDVNVLCADCTDVESGKVVFFKKEEPKEEPKEVEKVCKSCGSISLVGEDVNNCPDCGEAFEEGETVEPVEVIEPVEEPETPAEEVEEPIEVEEPAVEIEEPEEEKTEEVTEPEEVADHIEEPEVEEIEEIKEPEASVDIIEIETDFVDDSGEVGNIKQGMFDAPANTGWTVEKVVDVLVRTGLEAESFGLENAFPSSDALPVEISEKLKAQWGIYKEGKKFTLSKKYLMEATDLDIIDTIKHLYIHHHQYITDDIKVNHQKPFKTLCVMFGVSLEVPLKNHRAMK